MFQLDLARTCESDLVGVDATAFSHRPADGLAKTTTGTVAARSW